MEKIGKNRKLSSLKRYNLILMSVLKSVYGQNIEKEKKEIIEEGKNQWGTFKTNIKNNLTNTKATKELYLFLGLIFKVRAKYKIDT